MANPRSTPTAAAAGAASAPGAGAQPPVTDAAGQATADTVAAGAANQSSRPLEGSVVASLPTDPLLVKNGKVRPGSTADDTEYAELVRARSKGEYNGVRVKGDVFANERNLPTYPEDPDSWIEDADRSVDWEAEEKKANQRRAR
jgi:hypothetical protein